MTIPDSGVLDVESVRPRGGSRFLFASQEEDGGALHVEAGEDLARSDWSGWLRSLGVDAAVISYRRRGWGGSRVLARAFDRSGAAACVEDALMAEATGIWRTLGGSGPGTTSRVVAPSGRLAAHAAGPVLATRHESADAVLEALFLPALAGPFTPQLLAVVEGWMPMLSAATEAHLARARAARRARLLQGALDRLATPVILLDADARLLHRNEAGRTLLEGGDLSLDAEGALVCAGAARTRQLRAAVRAVARGGGADPVPRVVRLGDGPDGPILGFLCRTGCEGQAECATLTVPAPAARDVPDAALEALGLPPSERRFLRAFLNADGLREAAVAAGVSEETGRTYLKRIKGKLGVSRQVDLVRLMCGLAPPMRERPPRAAAAFAPAPSLAAPAT
jgi:hypothetical protein